MQHTKRRRIELRLAVRVVIAALALATAGATACGSGTDAAPAVATEEIGTLSQVSVITSGATEVAAESTAVATPSSPAADTPAADPVARGNVEVARASIALDGQADDWANVPGAAVPLIAIPEELREDPTAGGDVVVTLKVAFDDANIYLLVLVPDGYDYDPDNLHRSPALAIEWLVDEGAGAAMGALDPDFKDSGGMVDIWHWELDCGPGELSGGVFPTGNDPGCNLDDEYATLTDEREDDDRENSLTGSWDHTGRASGIGTDGTFVFEIARPLRTDDTQDAQFQIGATAQLGIAYWDGNEGREKDGGWTDAGHVTSADDDWIDVTLTD